MLRDNLTLFDKDPPHPWRRSWPWVHSKSGNHHETRPCVDGLLLGMTSKPCRWLPHDLIRRHFWFQKHSLDQFAIRCWITPSAGTTQHFWRVGAVSISLVMQTDVVFCVLLGEARLQDWKHTPSRLSSRSLLFAKVEMNRWDLVGDADNHTTAPRASASSKRLTTTPPRVENQAGTSWDDAWYVGLTCIIVTLIHYRKARSKRDEQKSIV
jgi:hypothetical protein